MNSRGNSIQSCIMIYMGVNLKKRGGKKKPEKCVFFLRILKNIHNSERRQIQLDLMFLNNSILFSQSSKVPGILYVGQKTQKLEPYQG